VPWPEHQQKTIRFLDATNKPANSKLETAPFNEFIWANPVAAEPLQERENLFTRFLLLGDRSTGNDAQAILDKPANASTRLATDSSR
jgi:hypothetical protein